MNGPVLIVAAHPDDEILGVGGTAALFAQQGREVHALILAEGATSRDPIYDVDKHKVALSSLQKNAFDAAKVLGISPPLFCGYPDNRLDSVDLLDVIKSIERVVEELQPTTVLTHHQSDLNIDHKITFEAVLTACRPVPGQCVKEILCFETLSSTEWNANPEKTFYPNYFVDITSQLAQKLKALQCYADEMRPYPHPRSLEAVEALAKIRGTSAGLHAAEAFVLIRAIKS